MVTAVGKPEDRSYIVVPEEYSRRELNSMYREIPLKDTVSRQLRKYFNAMANLYGIIPLRKAWEIISSQSPKLVTKEEFLSFAEIARHECEDYYILKDTEIYSDGKPTGKLDWKIIDVILFCDDGHALFDIARGQRGKPYYIPPKAKLLAYDDSSYYEPTAQTEALRKYLTQKLRLTPQNAQIAFDDILLYTRSLYGGVQKVINRVKQLGAVFNSGTIDSFTRIYQEFSNNARMQYNRGYTPNEIMEMAPPEDRFPKSLSFGPNIRSALASGEMDAHQLRQGILDMDLSDESLRALMINALNDAAQIDKQQQKPPKIGRNDPCPCGSGKKYKKCCGR